MIDQARELYQEARSLSDQGFYEGSAEKYREYLAISPGDTIVRARYGKVLRKIGDLEAAFKQYDEILRLRPGDRRAHMGRAAIFEQQGDETAAVEELRLAFAADHGDWMLAALLVRFLLNRGSVTEALKVCRAGLERKPNATELRWMYARALEKAGKLKAAAREFETVIAETPENHAPRLEYARVLGQLKRFEDSECEYRKALEAEPESEYANVGLAWLLFTKGEIDAAEAVVDEVRRAKPGNFEALRLSGEILVARFTKIHNQGYLTQAAAFFRSADAIQPDDPGVIVGRAICECHLHGVESAVSILEGAIDRGITSHDIRRYLMYWHIKKWRFRRALLAARICPAPPAVRDTAEGHAVVNQSAQQP